MKVQVAMRDKGALCRDYLSLLVILLLLFSVLPAAAAVDVTTFGPQRYDRLKGAPTVYTETFPGCSAADRVLLQVWNGDGKVTRITAAEIFVNGREIFAENDFKKAVSYLERPITTKGINDLKVVLKSGDYKEPSFLRIAVISNGCDTIPPNISGQTPIPDTLLSTPRPLLSAAYDDGLDAAASGIDPATVRLHLDSLDVTSASTMDAAAIRYLPLSDLADGGHTVTLAVADLAGNRASQSWSFATDTTPPVITVTTPADQSLSPVLDVTISGTLSEEADLFLNDQPLTLSDKSFSTPFRLTPGLNSLTLVAVDRAGNRGSTILTLLADNTPPVVTLTSPPDGLITNAVQQIISGSLSEVASLTLNGQAMAVEGLNFSTPYTLVKGENTLTVTAVDAAGNRGSASVVITLDTIAPQITISSPSHGSIRNSSEVSISGSVSEVVELVTVNGILAEISGTSFTVASLILPEGENSIVIEAVDRAGNRGTATLLLHVDIVAPLITIVTPAANAIVKTPQISVSGSVNETDATLTINGSTVALVNGAFSLANFPLHEGGNLIPLSAVDPAGNRTDLTLPLTLDTIPPQITLSAPGDQSFVKTPQISVSGTLSEEVATLTINGRSVSVSGTSFALADLTLLEGANEIKVLAVDHAGNSSTVTRTVTLDTIPPQLVISAPLSGTLLASATIDLQAQADELLISAGINDHTASVDGQRITATAIPLSEGENLLRLIAFDRAGNQGTAQVTVVRDSTPPPAPLFTLPLTLTRIPQLTLSGQAEGGANVTLLAVDSGAILAVVAGDAAGAFVFPELTLTEGENRFSAVAVDATGNRSLDAETLLITLDTIAPQLAITAPLSGSIGNQRSVTVTGSSDDPSAALTLNGQSVTLNGATFSHPVELQRGSNTLTLSAADRAGNHSSATVAVELDDVLPVITVTTPPDGLLTNAAQVSVSGQISESDCTVELGGTVLTVAGKLFNGIVALIEGENVLTLTASDRAGNRGSASLTITSDRIVPTLAIIAPATAVAGETLRLQITASDASGLTLVETSAAGRPFAAQATPASPLEQSLAYTLSPDLAPGTAIVLALRGLDGAGNSATVTSTVTISAGPSGPGYLQGEVYDDHSGLRLAGVTVEVTTAGTRSEVVTAEDGTYLFELPAGDYGTELSLAGYTRSYRTVALRPEQTLTVLDARLTALAPAVAAGYNGRLLAAPLEAGPAWSGPGLTALTVALPEGALSESLDVRLTPLSNQGLPAPLPRGWSPLAALDLRFTAAGLPLPEPILFFFPATLRLPLGDSGLAPGDELPVARYDLPSGRWLAQGVAIVSSDATAAVAALSREGIYALLLADPAPCTPPQPLAGEGLAATPATEAELSGWQADGIVAPAAAPPSLGLRAIGEVRLQPESELPEGASLASGLLLRGRVTEAFNLLSGEVVQPSDVVQDLLLYRAPCLSGAGAGRIAPVQDKGLRTTFPVTPSHQYTIAELLQGEVGIAIVPPETEQSGVLAGPEGALLLSDAGIGLTLPAGALERTVPVQLQSLDASAVAPLVPEGFTLLAAVRIDLARQILQTGALLSLPLPANFDPLRPVVLAQVFTAGGGERLRGVAFLKPVGSLLTSVTSVGGVTLPGIRAGGTYCLLQSESRLGLVRGTVRSASSQPFSGVLVTANSGSLADLSAASGSYLLFAPLGEVHLSALDLARFDRGESSATLAYAESVITLDPIIRPTVPSVVALNPDNGAVGVEPTTRISITFSEPIERSSITSSSIVLSAADGTPVSGVFSFSPDATVVSFYPEARLSSEGHYRLTIAGSVRDLQGYTLAAPLMTSFTVRDTTPPPLPTAGSITATFPDSEGLITVTATRGNAEYDATILIINDTSGEIVSIAPFSDGSFSARIHGQLGDEIQIVLMDNAGNQSLISYLTFSAEDGRTLVTAKGGKVSGEGGMLLDLPAGALVGPAIIKIDPVLESALPHPVPAVARFLGAVRIDSGNIPFQQEVKLSIPLPTDFPANAFPFLARPVIHTNPDGSTEEVYQLIDTVKIVDGRLTTASPPFSGVTGFGIFTFLSFPSPAVGPVVVSGGTYRDLNGQPGYQPNPDPEREKATTSPSGELLYNYDQPIRGAVIRSPGGYNFISYSEANGHYAAFGISVAEVCRPFEVTAIHPQTMYRHTANLIACDAPYIVNDLNFKLAEKGTTIPDPDAPVISLNLKVAAGQSGAIIAGTVPIGTALEVPISIIDQDLAAVTLVVTYQTPEMTAAQEWSMRLEQSAKTLSSPLQDEKPALFRYDYQANFSDPVSGANPFQFSAKSPGTYKIVVEAIDGTGNRATRTVQVRAINQGEQPASIDGAPQVDDLLPAAGAKEVMVTTPIIVTFSEPLDPATVTTANLRLVDVKSGQDVPVYLYPSIEGGQMRVTLQPQRNLQYDHAYRIIASTGIRDEVPNPGHGNVTLPMEKEVSADFTTKVPRAFDLVADERFEQGFGIDLFNNGDRTYAYVTARANGWRTIDITDPTAPQVVYTRPPLAATSFRGVGVDDVNGVLGITEDIRPLSGDQFGYVRFYDLQADPVTPPRIAQEKLAESFSGIPGRLALYANYAYIATVGAGVQVVDIEAAKNHIGISDGSSIVGIYDSIGQNFGQPNDVQVYGPGKLIVTTNSGYLLLLSIALPQVPTLSSSYPQGGLQATRAAAVSEYSYTAADGSPQTIDLAVIAGRDQLQTVDISDPYAPQPLGTAVNLDGSPAVVMASDITISKNAGLVFVSTFSEIQVFDIKDPRNPLLLQTITQLPDENGDMLPIGMTSGLVEKDGWVYLANQKDGMRVLDFDPHLLRLIPDPIRLDSRVSAKAKFDVNIQADIIPDPLFHAKEAYVVIYEGNSNEVWKSGAFNVLDCRGINTTVVFPAATAKNVDQSNRYLFDANKRYYAGVRLLDVNGSIYDQTPEERVAIPLSWPVLATDYNHNRTIDQSDLDRAARGDTFYFWINDDDDEGETEGDDIPKVKGAIQDLRDCSGDPRVDGIRDLIDFFPVAFDVKTLVNLYSPAIYNYRLKVSKESLNVVFPDKLTTSDFMKYLVNVDTAKGVALKPSFPVPLNRWPNEGPGNIAAKNSFTTFLANAATQADSPVLLFEGKSEGKTVLTLDVTDSKTNRVIFTSSLNLSLAGVEQMFRHKNLIKVLSEHSEYRLKGHDPVPSEAGMKDRLVKGNFTNQEHFAGFDAESDGNNFVHVHGYNVNGQDARGEQAETFKRLYWSGSRAKFWGVTWYGWESQGRWYTNFPCVGTRSPDFNTNVRHAFNTGRLLKEFVNQNVKSNVTVFAHSLGNMVVSSAIEGGMNVSHYLMVNAAVAEESYTPKDVYGGNSYEVSSSWRTSTKASMFHPEWRYPDGEEVTFEQGYSPRLWTSEWYKLFGSSDGRSILTWRDRFAKVRDLPGTYVYYSPTDEAFRPFNYTIDAADKDAAYPDNRTDWPGYEDILQNLSCFNGSKLGTYSWSLGELTKGRIVGDSGGWGFNLSDEGYWQTKNSLIVPIASAMANNFSDSQLREKPFFKKNSDYGFLYAPAESPQPVLPSQREELLAYEIPALTFAAGHKGVRTITVDNTMDIRKEYAVGKPQWPRGTKQYEWRHSDIYMVAYPYLSGLYDEWKDQIERVTP